MLNFKIYDIDTILMHTISFSKLLFPGLVVCVWWRHAILNNSNRFYWKINYRNIEQKKLLCLRDNTWLNMNKCFRCFLCISFFLSCADFLLIVKFYYLWCVIYKSCDRDRNNKKEYTKIVPSYATRFYYAHF